MTGRLLLGVVLAIGLAFPVFAQQSAITARVPDLVFEQTSRDFGEIYDDELQTHVFRFTNEGDGTLIIRDLRPTCKCTVSTLEKRSYAPGESGEIEVGFNPNNKEGAQHQRVVITSNDPDSPSIGLAITARVKPRFIIEPKLIDFGDINRGEEKSVLFQIAGRSEEFKIENLRFSHGGFSAEVLGNETVEIGGELFRRYEIRITSGSDMKVGRLVGRFDMNTNEPKHDVVSVNLTANVVGRIKTTPARVVLRDIYPGERFTTHITVESEDGPFAITAAEVVKASGLEAEARITQLDETRYRVMILGTPNEDERAVSGNIVVRTDVEGEESVTIKFYGRVRRK